MMIIIYVSQRFYTFERSAAALRDIVIIIYEIAVFDCVRIKKNTHNSELKFRSG